MKKFIFIFCIIFSLFIFSEAQIDTSKLTGRCPNTTAKSQIQFTRTGSINFIPCPSGTVTLNGTPITSGITGTLNGLSGLTQTLSIGSAGNTPNWSSTGTTHTLNLPFASSTKNGILSLNDWTTFNNKLSGDGTVNYLPYYNSSNVLANAPIKVNGETLEFFPDSAILQMNLDTANEIFEVKSNGTAYLKYEVGNDRVTIGGDYGTNYVNGRTAVIGDGNDAGNSLKFIVQDNFNTFAFESGNSTTNLDLLGINKFYYSRTITLGTGNVTINQPLGTVNVASGSASVTVTNNTVTANSIIFISPRSNDATCSFKNVVASSGSFVINTTANCTNSASFGFMVTN